MGSTIMPRLTAPQRVRAEVLEAKFRTSELAHLLAVEEARRVRANVRAGDFAEALRSIARGDWTAEGARDLAQRTLDAASPQGRERSS